MLAKVIPLKATARFSVRAVANYIAEDRPQKDDPELHSADPTAVANYINREGVSEGGSFNLDGLDPGDIQDRALIIQQMDHVARAGQHKTGFSSNPFYHFVLSWREGEHPDLEQAAKAAQSALKALRMTENQAIFAIHRDKEHHHHIHVVVNRVNPDTLTLSGPPKYDYLILDRVCREIELAQGWQHDHGPHVVVDGEIRRVSKADRERLGLIKASEGQVPAGAGMGESKSGLPSLARWMQSYVAHELLDCETWEDVHIALAKRGMRLEKLRSGLQVVAIDADGKETRTKASAVDYQLSLGRLEKRMGAYRDFQPSNIQPVPALTYSRHLENVMRGVEPAAGEIPARTGKSAQRTERRKERQEARDALYERYRRERREGQSDAKSKRAELALRHKDQLREVRKNLAAIRPMRISELTEQHGRQIALALWAAERAHAIQIVQAQQQIEKAALRRAVDLSWKAWLERQAAEGDQAAKAALRGIRYREQRKAKKNLPGFEGEDLDDLVAAPSARGGGEQKESRGGIAGTLKTFDLSRFEIDHFHQRVIYRDEDGVIALEDLGQRIECRQHDSDEVVRAGLLLAAQKYGGEVFITGDEAFKRRAAEIARGIGVHVANPELQNAQEMGQQYEQQQEQQQEHGKAGGKWRER